MKIFFCWCSFHEPTGGVGDGSLCQKNIMYNSLTRQLEMDKKKLDLDTAISLHLFDQDFYIPYLRSIIIDNRLCIKQVVQFQTVQQTYGLYTRAFVWTRTASFPIQVNYDKPWSDEGQMQLSINAMKLKAYCMFNPKPSHRLCWIFLEVIINTTSGEALIFIKKSFKVCAPSFTLL